MSERHTTHLSLPQVRWRPGVALIFMLMAEPMMRYGVAGAQQIGLRGTAALPPDLSGAWRVTTGVVAPWITTDSASLNRTVYLARRVQLRKDSLVGPAPLACDAPRYVLTSMPPEGLFQGNLTAPVITTARALGFTAGEIRGVRITCAAGVFEAHLVDPTHLMIAVDNVIWTLDRSPGALAARATPEGVVQALLERHFAGGMVFDSAGVRPLLRFLSRALQAKIGRYFAAPVPNGEAPAINGDPFSDSQEYPTRFAVQRAAVRGSRASVTVQFADGYAAKTVRYLLRSTPAGWRVDDVAYDARTTLIKLLGATNSQPVDSPAFFSPPAS